MPDFVHNHEEVLGSEFRLVAMRGHIRLNLLPADRRLGEHRIGPQELDVTRIERRSEYRSETALEARKFSVPLLQPKGVETGPIVEHGALRLGKKPRAFHGDSDSNLRVERKQIELLPSGRRELQLSVEPPSFSLESSAKVKRRRAFWHVIFAGTRPVPAKVLAEGRCRTFKYAHKWAGEGHCCTAKVLAGKRRSTQRQASIPPIEPRFGCSPRVDRRRLRGT